MGSRALISLDPLSVRALLVPGLRHLGQSFACDGPIAVVDQLPDDYYPVSDVVAFPSDDELQRGGLGLDNDPGSARSFSKFGLFVRAGADFQIHVAGDSQANALIGWSNVGLPGPVSSIAVDGCPGSCESTGQPECPAGVTGQWAAYPGGIWTLEPSCVSLVILTADTTSTVKLPVGERCR